MKRKRVFIELNKTTNLSKERLQAAKGTVTRKTKHYMKPENWKQKCRKPGNVRGRREEVQRRHTG